MTTTTKNETRTLAEIERELENVRAAQAAITDELASIAAKMDQSVKAEAEAVERAVRAGNSPKASGQVAKLDQRRAELGRQQAVTEVLADKLLAERLVLVLADDEEEQRVKNVASNAVLEKFRAVEAELAQAQSEAQWARERTLATREQLVAVRRRLALKGVQEPGDLEEQRKNAEQAEQHRQHAANWAPTYHVFS